MRITLLNSVLVSAAIGVFGGCASFSKGECISGNWSDIGYKDGANGKSRGRLADYSKICAKHGVEPNRSAYLKAFEDGLVKYCTYERGYALGENGSAYNQVCSGNLSNGFSQGYDEGRAVYELYREHKRLIGNYEDTLNALVDVRSRLAGDNQETNEAGEVIPITAKERKRLTKKQYRLEAELEDIRQDVRDFEYANNLPRHKF